LGENTKLVLTALYQKSFKGTNQKASELIKEVSPSRTALKLEEGDLVLEVRKLGKESSFLVETKIAQAGIRGTQFKVSASADSAELSVLEGRVDFLDAEKLATPVETAKKAGTRKGVPAKLEDMSASEQAAVKQAVEQSKQASASIDLNRLANTVDGYEPKPNYIVKSALNMELVWCPPGGFEMGPSILGKGGKKNSPTHPVILTKGFYLGKYEVTQEQYEKVMGENPSKFKGPKFPVEKVNGADGIAFCEALAKKERVSRGWVFSLPTEAQWEYACRAGNSTRFPWGDTISPKMANYSESGFNQTTEVGSFNPNPWGFHDMHGNVWELCLDKFGPYSNNLVIDPINLDSRTNHVIRGGGWKYDESKITSTMRHEYNPSPIFADSGQRGFRVALVQAD